MATYTVRRYTDGIAVGSIELTDDQFRDYERIAQQPEGLIRLGDKAAFPFYDLDSEYQDLGPDTVVFLD